MPSELLMRSELDAGLNLVKALDGKGFGVTAALWRYKSETERWRMVIAYRGNRADLQKKYWTQPSFRPSGAATIRKSTS